MVLDVTGCPLNYITPLAADWARWFGFWRQGWLPLDGGVLDQPAKFIEVMEYLDGLSAKKEAARANEHRTRAHPALS